MDVAVVGSTGFIGTAIVEALRGAGHVVRGISAPRLREDSHHVGTVAEHAVTHAVVDGLRGELSGVDVVVNAAGMADPRGDEWATMAGANSLLPGVIAAAAGHAGVGRIVHVSSMAVQGRIGVLDESATYASFSPYSESKQLGEQVLLTPQKGPQIVILRPGSVHGVGRSTTEKLARFARSRLSSVAGSGAEPSPQNLVQNVARAAAFLVDAVAPPPIVLQPWEGVTTSSLLRQLGGREPAHVPPRIARAVLLPIATVGALSPTAQAWARRLELLWFGQPQVEGYLDDPRHHPEHSDATWLSLAEAV